MVDKDKGRRFIARIVPISKEELAAKIEAQKNLMRRNGFVFPGDKPKKKEKMSKEKTIPDPPAHIKNWIMDEWNVVDSVSEHEISGSQGFRLGASIMYKKNQEELEERSVGFAEWLINHELNFQPTMKDGILVGIDLVKYSMKTLYDQYLKPLNQ